LDLYDFSKPVAFKPTKARVKPFRITRKAARSYFVAGDPVYPEDHGFALNDGKGYSAVRFENAVMRVTGENAIAMGRLFNLYSKQIEKYQQETRTRASWSFVFAIISMFLGMAFVFWGGTFILSDTGTDKVAAGAAISAIGGGISAYITKTFLDVHKLSLTQLNKYFKQPVINDNILMAQRLADDVDDTEVRKESYKNIIDSITGLIVENGKDKK